MTLANIFAPLSPLYLVGGAVRNSLLGLESGDYDIASSVTTSKVKDLLLGSKFMITAEYSRTGTLLIKGDCDKYEYTTFREDSYPIDSGGHTPADVRFTSDIRVDASRRDFTCNALYYDIAMDEIVDLVGGVSDTLTKIIKTVKSGDITLAEDALRIMRLVRFSSQLGFIPSEDTSASAMKYASRLADISKERIHDELVAILNAPEKYNAKWANGDRVLPSDGLRMLVDIGAMDYIIPELLEGIGLIQNAKYHIHDVYEHILHAIDHSAPHIRLAALFHDIAKPKLVLSTGTMYGHDIEGERMTREIMTRLKFSSADIEHTARLVGMHMFNLDNQAKDSTIRKFIADNYNYMEDYLSLRDADSKASREYENSEEVIGRTVDILHSMTASKVPIKVSDMDIRGGDLTCEGYSGQQVGAKLRELWLEQVTQGIRYSREQLLSRIRR